MTRLEKLMLTVSLVDKASGPAAKLQTKLDELNNKATAGMGRIAAGSAGLFATGYALNSLLEPQREMSKAIGEIRSMDVAESTLKNLEKQALRFSVKYGESATDFVRSAYDIQGAISSLKGDELGKFTNAGNILAKATKSNADTITNYMGTMYGIFQKDAEKMGKSDWVDKMAGQTAMAVNIFKSSGDGMSAAFTSIGADATSAGIAMGEQMAVLGTLQATMPGSEAGTKYKAFLAGVGNAQKTLGLRFTDAQGKLLPMVDILNRIKGKYGDIDTVAKADLLKKAFGSKEAVGLVKLLAIDTATLAGSIEQINNTPGLSLAEKMAGTQVDSIDRFFSMLTALKIMMGGIIRPVLEPFWNAVTAIGEKFMMLVDEYPMLGKVLGYLTVAIFGVIAGMSLLLIIIGTVTLFKAGWGIITTVLAAKIAALNIGMRILGATMWILNSAFLANPITWIVLGVMALIGGVYLLVQHWDALKASIAEVGVFGTLLKMLGWVWEKVSAIIGLGGIDVEAKIKEEQVAARQAAPEIYASGKAATGSAGGGLMQQYSNINKTSNGARIDKVIINTNKVDDQTIKNLALSG